MDLVTIDRALARLEAALTRAGRNLFQLEVHPTWAMLLAADVEGLTLQRREGARAALTDVFAMHVAVRDVVDAAAALRRQWTIVGPQRLDRLDAFLHGTSVVVADVAVPVEERGLVADSHVAIRVTPDEALTRMSSAFDEVLSCVADVEMRWQTLPQRLNDTRARVHGLAPIATDDDVGGIVARLDELARCVLADPLAIEPDAVDRLAAEVDDIARAGSRAAAMRDAGDEVLVELRRRVDRARSAVEECDGRYRYVIERLIAAPARPAVDPSTLMECWESVCEAVRAGCWRVAADRCAVLERSLDDAEAAVAAALQSYDALLLERDELRGRFGAYRAKAEALDLVDDSDVADALARARRELWTAPTDLHAAGRVLQVLGRALSAADGALGECRP
jgi:hypothetical protein